MAHNNNNNNNACSTRGEGGRMQLSWGGQAALGAPADEALLLFFGMYLGARGGSVSQACQKKNVLTGDLSNRTVGTSMPKEECPDIGSLKKNGGNTFCFRNGSDSVPITHVQLHQSVAA